jgi:hypothetical protein
MKPQRNKSDRRQARAWMVMRSLRPLDIQKALGHRYHTQVVETLAGDRDDRRVLTWLRDNGCPDEYLNLPTDMMENER